MKRTSYDTSIKHLTRHGLIKDVLTNKQIALIPSSNLSRWKNEPDEKYVYSELNEVIKQEVQLIKRMNQSSKIKKMNLAYFKLADTFHEILSKVKGVKLLVKEQKELVVNTVIELKDIIPINVALKVFNISRTTFHNYQSIVIHKCEASYFKWCTRRFNNQLLPIEVETIKKYMTDQTYIHWSKSSIYLRAVRDKNLYCCLSTFYKYCRLLGFKNSSKSKKSDYYKPLKTNKPNEVWSADVTIFKTSDGIKHYIHILMDHYSKMILGYKIMNSNSAITIKELLEEAYFKYNPLGVEFISDGGVENVNTTVSEFLNSFNTPIKHMIAQKTVVFSNSMIEALNKVIKHQYLYSESLSGIIDLKLALTKAVNSYNTVRPHWSLGGNTPLETYTGSSINFNKYKSHFSEQKVLRVAQNKENGCKQCLQ